LFILSFFVAPFKCSSIKAFRDFWGQNLRQPRVSRVCGISLPKFDTLFYSFGYDNIGRFFTDCFLFSSIDVLMKLEYDVIRGNLK